ncbi:MAG: VOC family protein [Gammaproteobacteria bacterium]|nr:VOC family protein [Gammaproteobacteria bacterium]
MEQIAPLEVGLPVIDMEKMHDFYCRVLSFEEVRRADIPPELTQALTAGADGYLNVWLRSPHGEIIKLVRPPVAPERSVAPAALSTRTGFGYLTFYCKDIERVLAEAEASGAKVRSDRGLLDGRIGVKLIFFEDPEGNVIELVEPVATETNG